uniref:Uncharacterized protein n=1 Tax=Romanomermis culicivorax TaxID=13658 RepID=A0A915K174_ROMCU
MFQPGIDVQRAATSTPSNRVSFATVFTISIIIGYANQTGKSTSIKAHLSFLPPSERSSSSL